MAVDGNLLRRTALSMPMLLILFDQAIISGTRLVCQLTVGRWGGAEQLGLFGMSMGFVMLLACFQEALVTTPLTVFLPRQDPESRENFSARALWMQLLLSVILVCLLAIFVIAKISLGNLSSRVATVLIAAIWFAPLFLIREFVRRWLLARGDTVETLLLDVIASAVSLVMIGGFVLSGQVEAWQAFLFLLIGNLVYAALWFAKWRHQFPMLRASPAGFLPISWRYGRWIAGENFFNAITIYYLSWHLVYFLSETKAGYFQSCMTVVLLANPFLLGFTSFLGPRAATTFHQHGWPALWRLTWRSLTFVTAVLGVLAILLGLQGENLLVLIFGDEFAGQGRLVGILGLGMLGMGISYVATCALQTADFPQANFVGSVVSGVFLVGWSLAFVHSDLKPAATGFVLSIFAGVLVRLAGLAGFVARDRTRGISADSPGGSSGQ